MCFSPEVSFIASGGLTVVGVATAGVAPKQKKIFAIIPFAFAIQQAVEGVQWLWLRAGTVCVSAAYGFLFFAFFIWPVMIPIAVYMIDKERRCIVRWFIAVGIPLSLYSFFLMLTHGVDVIEIHKSIQYSIYNPLTFFEAAMVYAVIAIGPLCISTIPAFRWFGVAAIISAAVTYYFFTSTFISVWCFFAAVLSVSILFYVYRERQNGK